MTPLAHRIGAAVVVTAGLIGAFGGLVAVTPPGADAAPADTATTPTTAAGPRLTGDAASIMAASAEAMGQVTSVRFEVSRTGAPVFIDTVDELALDAVVGRFRAPGDADAIVTVTVSGDLVTELGAIAVGSQIWLSNPITGVFEPLPPSYDLDPSSFFDPADGWRPLLAGMTDLVLVAADETIHVRGTAPATELRTVTAGLVGDDGVVVDLWLDPYSALVTRIEFSVEDQYGVSDWTLRLSGYGELFEILPPPGADS